MATATGVPTRSYAPDYLFGRLSTLVRFAMALRGRGGPTTSRTEQAQHAD